MASVSPEEAKGTNFTKRKEAMRENRRELKRKCLGVLCRKDTQKGFSDFEDVVVVGRGGSGTRMVGVFRTVAICEAQSETQRER